MYKSNPERELHCSDCLLKIKHFGTLVEPHLFSRAPSKPLEYIPHDPALLWPMSPHTCLGGNVTDMSQHVGDDTTCRSNFGQMGPCRQHYFFDVVTVCVGLSRHILDFPKCVCRNILWYGGTYSQILLHPHALNAHFIVLLLPPRSFIR